MAGTVWLEERREMLLCGGGPAPPMQEVGCVGVWCNVIDLGVVLLLALFWWASGGRSKFIGEWSSLRKRMVLLWACSGPSLLAQLPVH